MANRRLSNASSKRFLFASRWLMVPFYLGLVVALAGLLVVFVHELIEHLPALLDASGVEHDAVGFVADRSVARAAI